MVKAAIFDVDGTLVDSVDLHALAWHEAFREFGHEVSFESARSQIGKGGDQLLPMFLTDQQQRDYGEQLEGWRSQRFRQRYLPLVRPFTAVPEFFARFRDAGVRIAIASSASDEESRTYLQIAGVEHLVEVTTSSDDAERSKPAPDIFAAALEKVRVSPGEAVAAGDTPYDAQATGLAGMRSIGFLSGGFREDDLQRAGCVDIYPGPASLLATFDSSVFRR